MQKFPMMPHTPLRFRTTLITSRAIHTDMSLRSGSAPCSSCSSPSAQVRQCLLSFHYPPRRGPGPCLFNGGLTSSHAAFHVVQAIHTRLWWLFLTVVSSGVLEILGWAGRLWSSRNAYLKIPYLIQWVHPLSIIFAIRIDDDETGS